MSQEQMMELLAAVVAAARKGEKKGCHDTCSKALVDTYPCDCGYEARKKALAALDAAYVSLGVTP